MAGKTSLHDFSKRRIRSGLRAFAALTLVAAVSLPLSIGNGGLVDNAAAARGGGGNGGGNGGGHGGGHGKGHDGNHDSGHQLRASGTDGPGHGSSKKTTHNAAPAPVAATATAGETGRLTARLGSLNAAHASPRAFENASTNSVIGALRDYMDSLVAFVAGGDPQDAQDAADALQRAANKDSLIDPVVIDSVNELLDGKSGDFSHDDVAGDPVHESEDEIFDRINLAP